MRILGRIGYILGLTAFFYYSLHGVSFVRKEDINVPHQFPAEKPHEKFETIKKDLERYGINSLEKGIISEEVYFDKREFEVEPLYKFKGLSENPFK